MAQKNLEIIKTLGKNRVKLGEPLAKHTTFGVGGPADLFYEAEAKEELVAAIKLARKLRIPFFILGSGSNILVSDQGMRGLVIKAGNKKSEIRGEKILAEAGTLLAELVSLASKHSLSGLERCVGIPGTVGGAMITNAGTADKWIGDLVETVEILDEKNQIRKIIKPDCRFGYRSSRFKETKEIILASTLKLKSQSFEKINKKMSAVLEKRKNQPKEKSAGSIFKNPPGKVAGHLIEECGLKGEKRGQAQISPKHANFIINLGEAQSRNVIQLIELAREKVKKKFGIELEEEIGLLGFDKI